MIATHTDTRGTLQVSDPTPFPVRRVFVISDVPAGEVRGKHAHRHCHQYLWCVKGSFVASLESVDRTELTLRTGEGVLAKPLTWIELSAFSEDAVCVVLCSHKYEPEHTISDRKVYDALLAGSVQRPETGDEGDSCGPVGSD